MKVLEWPCQSPDFNLFLMLWHDLEKAIHLSSVTESNQLCKEQWANKSPQRYERLIASERKRLISVVTAEWRNQLLGVWGQNFFTQRHLALNRFFSPLNKVNL